jgi:predicted transposase/invertase (TIGR01784 family)
MSIGKFLNPRNDYAFKRIFGTEKNKDILIHFLNDMLGFSGKGQIKTVSFIKTTQDPEIASQKQSLIDVLCVDGIGRQYIVEMQIARAHGFEKRAQYYAAKAYSRQLNEGDKYHKLKEIIFLAITSFVMFPGKAAYKSDHMLLDKETHSHDLKDFHFSFLELPKFTKTIDELESVVEKWAYFFKHADETHEKDLGKIIGSDRVIERAYEELNRFFWTEIELNTYEQEEKRERDAQAILDQQLLDIEEAKSKYIEQGREEGIEKGKAEGIEEGMQKGIEKGIEEGVQKGEAALLQRLLQRRFGDLPTAYVARIEQADATMLLKWTENVLDAKTLEEIFKP